MDETKRGSGITSTTIMRSLHERSVGAFHEQLESLQNRKLLTKKAVADLEAGFSDGWGALLRHLIAMGIVVVHDDEAGK